METGQLRVFLKFIRNREPKIEEASAILNDLWDIVEDMEEIKMVYIYRHENLLTQESRNTNRKTGGRYD